MSVRKSLAWSYAAQAFIFVQTFFVSVIVARLLGPYEMGVFALGLSTVGALAVISSFGVGPYLIRHEAPGLGVISTVFTINALLSVTLSLIIVAVAFFGPLAGMNPDVRTVLLLLAVNPLTGIFDFLPSTFFQREMNFRFLSMLGMGRSIVTSITLLSMASLGFGYLSPPIAMLTSSLFGVAVTNIYGRRHISLRLSLKGWREMTRFGLEMLSIGGVSTLAQRLSELMIGSFLGVAALGIYSRASSLSNQIFDNVYGLSTRVIFSQMASEMRETQTVRRTFLQGLTMITGAIWPLLFGIAILSRPIIYTLYGEKWIGAALPLSIIMIAYFVLLVFGMNWELCVLKRKTGWMARNEAIRAVVSLISFGIGASFNLAAAASARVVEALSGLILFGPQMRDLAGTDRGEISRVYRQSALLSVAATCPSLAVMMRNDWSVHTSWLAIAPAVALGIGLWLVALKRLDHVLLHEIKRAIPALVAITRPKAG